MVSWGLILMYPEGRRVRFNFDIQGGGTDLILTSREEVWFNFSDWELYFLVMFSDKNTINENIRMLSSFL